MSKLAHLRRSFTRVTRAVRNEPVRAPPRARIGAPWEARWNRQRLRRVHPAPPTPRDFEQMEWIYQDARGAVASVRIRSRTVARHADARMQARAGERTLRAQQSRNARRSSRVENWIYSVLNSVTL